MYLDGEGCLTKCDVTQEARKKAQVEEEAQVEEGAVGVMCLNIGTPASYSSKDVRVYLKQFLSDPRIIQPWIVRLFVGKLVPYLRAIRSAQKYRSIWHSQHGSPLLYHGLALSELLERKLNDGDKQTQKYKVCLAMNYGKPSIPEQLARLMDRGVRKIVVLPLFAQYASSSFGSTLASLYVAASKRQVVPALRVLAPYYCDPGFIDLESRKLSHALKQHADLSCVHVVMSYHGVPLSQCEATLLPEKSQTAPQLRCGAADYTCCLSDKMYHQHCYRRQCVETSHLIASQLGLSPDDYSIGFQSRLGPARWTEPNTLDVLGSLAKKTHIKTIIITFPSFLSDCLETLEEIGLAAKEECEKMYPHLVIELVECPNSRVETVDYFYKKIQSLKEC